MLMPNKVKHRKVQRGRMKGSPEKGSRCPSGARSQSLEPQWVTARQIEAARIAITRYIKRGGKVDRIFPDKPITKKPAETRMGKGRVRRRVGGGGQAGRILFEIDGVSHELAQEAFRLAAHKLPLKTAFVVREGLNEGE